MESEYEIVKKERYISNGTDSWLRFPEITIASTGQKGDVTEVSVRKGEMTLTIKPHITEDTTCEVVQPLLIENKTEIK